MTQGKKAPRAIMTPEQIAEGDAALGFGDRPNHGKLGPNPNAGSLAPMKGDRMPAEQLDKLRTIEDKLRTKFDDWVKGHVRHMMAVGELMNEARALFLKSQDTEFGKWRADFLGSMDINIVPRTANTWMQIAREYKNAPEVVEKLGMSKARLLISASPAVQREVETLIDAGTPPTREQMVEMKREDEGKVEPITAPQGGRAPGPDTALSQAKPSAPLVTQDEMCASIRGESHFGKRLEMCEELVALPAFMRAYSLLGLLVPNDGEDYAEGVVEALIEFMNPAMNDDEKQRMYDLIDEGEING
jgi:hypothetical protein